MSGPAPKYAELNPDRIRDLYSQGLSQTQIGERMGVSQHTVSRAMRYFGIQARPRGRVAQAVDSEDDSLCTPARCPFWSICLDWPVDEPCRELQENCHVH